MARPPLESFMSQAVPPVASMAAQGRPPLDSFMATPQAPMQMPQQVDAATKDYTLSENMKMLTGGARALAKGVTYGQAGKAEALLGSILNPGKSYQERRKELSAKEKQFDKDHPILSMGGEIVGAIASPLSKIGAGVKGAKLITDVLKKGGVGALQSLAYTAGTSETPLADIPKSLMYGGGGAAALALAPKPFKYIGGKIKEGIEKMPGATLGQALGGRLGEMTRRAEKFMSQSILGQPLRKAEERQIELLKKKFDDLTPQARSGYDNFAQFLSTAAKNAKDAISKKQEDMYENVVYKHVKGRKEAPALADETRAFVEEAKKTLSPKQREWLDNNVIAQLDDQAGLNLGRLQQVKKVTGAATEEGGSVFSANDPVINKLYGTLRNDFYKSITSNVEPSMVGTVRKGIEKADKFTARYLSKGGTKDTLDQFAKASPDKKAVVVDKLLNSLKEGKTEAKAVFNTLLRRFNPEDKGVLMDSLHDSMMNMPKGDFTKVWEGMGAKTRERVFGGNMPEFQNIYNQMKSLKIPSLNPSGSAVSMLDLAAMGLFNIPHMAATYGGSYLLANPEKLLKAGQMVGKFLPSAETTRRALPVITGG